MKPIEPTDQYLFDYSNVLLFLAIGVVFVLVAVVFSSLLSWLLKHRKPNAVKSSTYECGALPVGSSYIRFNIRFYIVALIFIIFDVEVVALFPWAIIFNDKLSKGLKGDAWVLFADMAIFVLILVVGLIFVWRKGDLAWVKGHKEDEGEAARACPGTEKPE